MDKRAVRILMSTFWCSDGWKPEGARSITPEELAYAKSKRVMFDAVTRSHAQTLELLSDLIGRTSQQTVANAFLSSLSTRRLDHRSALGSYAVFRSMKLHRPSSHEFHCAICGYYLRDAPENLNVLNFERLKWGGVRHDHPGYALLDLSLFLQEPPPSPSSHDVEIFKDVLRAIELAPSQTTSASLHKEFRKALKSNKAERDTIVAILGFCGILTTTGHPTYAEGFVPFAQRVLPSRRFVDMPYPACWWKREDGIDTVNLNAYFGHVL